MKLRSVIADYIAFRQSIGQTFRRRYLLFAFNCAVGAELDFGQFCWVIGGARFETSDRSR